MMSTPTSDMFSSFQHHLERDQELREDIRSVVREMEHKMREILAIMQKVHHPDGPEKADDICKQARLLFNDVQVHMTELKKKVPIGQYYRYHDHWRFAMQRLSFIVAFIVYLETLQLTTREQVAELLGICVSQEEGFHLDLDDFLLGILLLVNELSRLSVNAVTGGDYAMPFRIAKFVAELDSGFRLLNLKNDNLRKRFDGLKYDLKKVEEVVYDVKIRGLQPSENT